MVDRGPCGKAAETLSQDPPPVGERRPHLLQTELWAREHPELVPRVDAEADRRLKSERAGLTQAPRAPASAVSPSQPPSDRSCLGLRGARRRNPTFRPSRRRRGWCLMEPAVSASTGRARQTVDPRPPETVSQLDQASACSRVTGQAFGRRHPYDVRKARSLTEDSRTKSQSARTRCACSSAPSARTCRGLGRLRVTGRDPGRGGCPGRTRPTPSSALFHRQRRPARLMGHSRTFAQARLLRLEHRDTPDRANIQIHHRCCWRHRLLARPFTLCGGRNRAFC